MLKSCPNATLAWSILALSSKSNVPSLCSQHPRYLKLNTFSIFWEPICRNDCSLAVSTFFWCCMALSALEPDLFIRGHGQTFLGLCCLNSDDFGLEFFKRRQHLLHLCSSSRLILLSDLAILDTSKNKSIRYFRWETCLSGSQLQYSTEDSRVRFAVGLFKLFSF